MISFLKSIPKHCKSAAMSIIRHLAMSLSASSAVTITLILFSAFLIVAGNVSQFTNSIENDLRVHVVLEDGVTKKQALSETKGRLEDIPGVKKAEFSSKKQELDLMIQENGKEFEMYINDNPLSNAFFVSVKNADNIASITSKIKAVEHVKSAVYGGTSVSKMISVLNTIRTGGLVFVVLLCFLAVFLISNTIKMTIYARNTEISIMRFVGASNTYIKVPFMIEGMLIGFVGAILPCIATFFGYRYLYNMANGQLLSNMFELEPVMPFALQLCGILLVAGMSVGIIGSFFSTTRYLKWKR